MKSKRRQAKLSLRVRDYMRGPTTRPGESRQNSRWTSGGYHQPGSNKK